jgi:hypothetical protein
MVVLAIPSAPGQIGAIAATVISGIPTLNV